MCPTLNYSGDYLLSVRTTFLKTFLQRKAPHVSRGDLIDFVSPRDPSYSACKRVIGIEGDVVCLDPSDISRTGKDQVWIRVPVGHLWVAGDNLSNSVDSREYGPLPLGLVRGKIMARVSRLSGAFKEDRKSNASSRSGQTLVGSREKARQALNRALCRDYLHQTVFPVLLSSKYMECIRSSSRNNNIDCAKHRRTTVGTPLSRSLDSLSYHYYDYLAACWCAQAARDADRLSSPCLATRMEPSSHNIGGQPSAVPPA